MTKLHKNPFRFGDPVEGSHFLAREGLMNTVCQFLENRIHVVIIGPRRFGKTSFTLDLLRTLEKKGYECLFVDIFNITSHKDFAQQLLRAMDSKKNWQGNFTSWMRGLLNIRPKMTAEYDVKSGHTSLGLSVDASKEEDVKELIQNLLSGVEKLGDQVIFAIDEFQKVAEIGDGGWLEATLRTHMQQTRNCAFLFTGSRKSIIADMLNNQSRPFYRSCQPIEFPTFGEEFTSWIVEHFESVHIKCDKEAISSLRKLVQETPNYVQMVCFHLVAQGCRHVTEERIKEALKDIVKQNNYAYQALLSTLTPTQHRALRLVANEGTQIYAKDKLAKYEISSGPALASAIKALKDKGILDQDPSLRAAVAFEDPLLAIWLASSF